MNIKMRNEFDIKIFNWVNAKNALCKEAAELKDFLFSLENKIVIYNKKEYKITRIIWDPSCDFFGGTIEMEMQNCSLIYKLIFQTFKYVHFADFSNGIDDGTFVVKD